MAFARSDTSAVARWWWTVDRWTLSVLLSLLTLGVILALAASPAVAMRVKGAAYFFVYRHVVYALLSVGLMIGISLLSPAAARRAGVLLFAGAFFLMLLTLLIGPEVNGAQRWLYLGPLSVQPSEFVKPGFVIVCAWMFAEARRGDGVPGNLISLAILLATVSILVMQPDFGQTFLIVSVWSAMFFMAGVSYLWIMGLALVAAGGAVMAYLTVPHVASRVDRFFDPTSGDTHQTDTALDAIVSGGLMGRGPGEGILKRILPDAHTDFIFAVAGEEFGILVCMLVVAGFAFVVIRGLARVLDEQDHFVQLAAGGLITLFGLQALVHIAVNVNLLPAKGMTLPLISYGGSSSLAIGLTMGLALALTRRRAGVRRGAGGRP